METTGESLIQQCSSCASCSARCWCLDCNEAMCEDCVSAHRRVTVTRSHRLINQLPRDQTHGDLSRTEPEHLQLPSGNIWSSPIKFCRIHPSEPLQLFCFTCNLLTCRDCQLMAHMNHRYLFASEAQANLKRQLEACVQPIRAQRDTVRRSLQDMTNRLTHIDRSNSHMKAQLQKIFLSLAVLLRRRVENMVKEIEKVHELERKRINQRMVTLKQLQQTHTYLTETAEKARNTGNLSMLLTCTTQMQSQLKDLLVQDSSPPSTMAQMKITASKKTLETISHFGALSVSWVPFNVPQTSSGNIEAPPPAAASSTPAGIAPIPLYKPRPQPLTTNHITSPVPDAMSSNPSSTCTDADSAVGVPVSSRSSSLPSSSRSWDLHFRRKPKKRRRKQVFSSSLPTSFSSGSSSSINPTCSMYSSILQMMASSNAVSPQIKNLPPSSSDLIKFLSPVCPSTLPPPKLPPPTLPPPTLPSPTLPSPTVPSPTLPSPTLPSPTLPSPTLLSSTLPSPTLPPPKLPSPTLPPPKLPSPTLPPPTLLSSTLPPPKLPPPTLPPPTLLSSTLPSPTLPSPTLPSPTLPSPTLPSPTLPSPTLLSSTLPPPTLPSPTLPSPKLPSPTLLPPTLPSPTLPPPTLPSPTRPPSIRPPPTNLAITFPSSTLPSLTLPSPTCPPSTRLPYPYNAITLPPPTRPTPTYHTITRPPPTRPTPTYLAITCPPSTHLPSTYLAITCPPPSCPPSTHLPPTRTAPTYWLNTTRASMVQCVQTASPVITLPPTVSSTVLKSAQQVVVVNQQAPPVPLTKSLLSLPSVVPQFPMMLRNSSLWTTLTFQKNTCLMVNAIQSQGSHSEKPLPEPEVGQQSERHHVSPQQSPVVTDQAREEPAVNLAAPETSDGDAELSSPETSDGESEESSHVTEQQVMGLSQWQPTVPLVRLPVSLPPPGCPLPTFRLVGGFGGDEVYVQELNDDSEIESDADTVDFTEPLSSPESPESPESPMCLEILSCAACGSASTSVICSSCGRGYHRHCHVPPVGLDIRSEWFCSLCQDLSDPLDPYKVDRPPSPQMSSLSLQNLRRCESLLLHLKVEGCRRLPESRWSRLQWISERLSCGRLPLYQTAHQVVSDIWTVFEASQDDALDQLQQSFQRKLKETLRSELHPSFLKAPKSKPADDSTKDKQLKLSQFRKRLRDLLDVKNPPSTKRTKME